MNNIVVCMARLVETEEIAFFHDVERFGKKPSASEGRIPGTGVDRRSSAADAVPVARLPLSGSDMIYPPIHELRPAARVVIPFFRSNFHE